MIHSFDVAISKKIQAALSGKQGAAYAHPWVERFWEVTSARGAFIYAAVMFGLLLLLQDHRVFIWMTPVIVTAILTIILQAIFRRPRPSLTKTEYRLWIQTCSFPSNHAASSFAFASSLSYAFLTSSLETAWLFAIGFYVLAILISLSRIVVGVHYAGDVAAGIVFGTGVTLTLLGGLL